MKITVDIKYLRLAFAAIVICWCLKVVPVAVAADKIRVVVLSDISNEPDDQQSLVRFLTYANEFEVEGIIATTSCWRRDNPDKVTILKVLDAYEQALSNLRIHADGYPDADKLRSMTKAGVDGYGMPAAIQQLDNEGIKHIVSVLERDDSRPVWFCVWGGGNTLGGAIEKLRRERSPEEVSHLVSKIRGYEIALQDDGFAYIAHHYPDTKLISAKLLWKGISRTTLGFNAWSESWGGDNSIFSPEWVKRNIQSKGPLGAQYPDAVYLWEGDTPSFLHLIPNGLSDPENPHWGGWGGRFEAVRKQNIRTGTGNDSVDGLLERHQDYALFSDAQDAWSHAGKNYQNEYATVFRWRQDFQNDFVARTDWTVTDDWSKANHPPRAVVDDDVTNRVLIREVSAGIRVLLSATGSSDPDGDGLSYRWFVYPEAGTHSGVVSLDGEITDTCTVTMPAIQVGESIHVILAVTDNGQPALTRYRRIVLKAL